MCVCVRSCVPSCVVVVVVVVVVFYSGKIYTALNCFKLFNNQNIPDFPNYLIKMPGRAI